MHTSSHPLSGQKVKIKAEANELGGKEILIENWQDIVFGKSWMDCNGNPAALNYATRSAFSKTIDIPTNDEVVYGKIGGLGYIVHVKELES